MSNGEPPTEEEIAKAKIDAQQAAERLKQKLSQPGASLRYEATPSSVYDAMLPGWGDGLKL